MEIPEKIYLTTDGDNSFVFTQKRSDNKGIEYIRKDAFIERVCEFLSKPSNYNEGFIYPSHSGVIDTFVNNFKNYMKGE